LFSWRRLFGLGVFLSLGRPGVFLTNCLTAQAVFNNTLLWTPQNETEITRSEVINQPKAETNLRRREEASKGGTQVMLIRMHQLSYKLGPAENENGSVSAKVS
jgi:hypothetical protein